MQAPLDTDVTLEAPEHIVFTHAVAGPARRAWLPDRTSACRHWNSGKMHDRIRGETLVEDWRIIDN